jgi:formylglycine-generating enzyme required for sulfatase activity
MVTRAALALLLFLSAAASAQELEKIVSAVVRISGTRGGAPVRGSGFVVGLERDKATIVTASHVIEGVQHLEVIFAADPTERFPADVMLGMDADDPNGLAAFQVRGALPAGVTILTFEVESRPHRGDELFLVGFPQMGFAPLTPRRALTGRRGTLLLVDQGIGEGFSGGPVLQGGKVVGVVTDTDGQTTYAVSAVVAREALEGWEIKLGGQSSEPALPPTCSPGEEERTAAGVIFVRICPGTFTMGSAENDPQINADEKPAHQVTLSEFWIGKTEITNEQFRNFRSDHRGETRLPVTDVSWTDARAACAHFAGRLPTEAEWEYAARAGSHTPWAFGADEEMLDEYAWYGKSSSRKPHPSGVKKSNAWGIYDMHGDVSEWVADWYGPYPAAPQHNPTGPKIGEYRVLRGGAFSDPPWFLRSAIRFRYRDTYSARFIGFRCAHDPHPPHLTLPFDLFTDSPPFSLTCGTVPENFPFPAIDGSKSENQCRHDDTLWPQTQ